VKYVTMMGAVWKMSDRNFEKLARELKDNGGCVENMDAYGKEIIDRLYSVSEIAELVGDYNRRRQ